MASNFDPNNSPLPEIPSLPSELMVPPACMETPVSSVWNAGTKRGQANQEADHQEVLLPSGGLDYDLIHQEINQMRKQQSEEDSMMKDLQSKLAVKAHEMERLKTELQQFENHSSTDQPSRASTMTRNHLTNSMRPRMQALDTAGLASLGLPRPMPQSFPGVSGMQARSVAPAWCPTSGTEEAILKETAAQVDDLKTRLKATTDLCVKQESFYREHITSLENKLKEVVSGRDELLSMRQVEAKNQEQLIHQLQSALQQLHNEKQQINQELESLRSKSSTLDQDNQLYVSALKKVQGVLSEEEKRRGRSGILETNSDKQQTMDLMLEVLQNCLQQDKEEKQILQSKLSRMEADVKSTTDQACSKVEQVTKEFQNKLQAVEQEHQQHLDISSTRSASLRKQVAELQEEADKLRQQSDDSLRSKNIEIATLQHHVDKMQEEFIESSKTMEEKIKDLERSVKEKTEHIESLSNSKDNLSRGITDHEGTINFLKERIIKLEKDHDVEREKGKEKLVAVSEQLEKVEKETIKLKSELEEKDRLLNLSKEEANTKLKEKLEATQKEESEKANSRLDGVLGEFNKVTKELAEKTKLLVDCETDLAKVKEAKERLNESLEQQGIELCTLREDKITLNLKYEEAVKECDDVKQQVQNLQESSKQKTQKLKHAGSIIEKLRTKLEEREEVISVFKQQGSSISEFLDKTSQATDALRKERDEALNELREKTEELEALNDDREALVKKLKQREKQLRDTELGKEGADKAFIAKKEEFEALLEDRDNALNELKVRQMEVAKLKDEKSTLQTLFDGKSDEKDKEVSKLLSRLKGSETDLILTKKLLETKREMSGKAVRAAGSMQKEVTDLRNQIDSLQIKKRWLKETLDSTEKAKVRLETRLESMSAELQEVTAERDTLLTENKQVIEKLDHYTSQVSQLERALEKAAVKFAESQATIERQEQEMARMKLKHSLDLKEQQRVQKSQDGGKPEITGMLKSLLNPEFTTRLQSMYNYSSIISRGAAPVVFPEKPQPPPLQGNMTEKDESTLELKSLLQDLRSLLSNIGQSSFDRTPVTGGTASEASHSTEKQALNHSAPVRESDLVEQRNSKQHSAPVKQSGHPSKQPEDTASVDLSLQELQAPLHRSSPKKVQGADDGFSEDPEEKKKPVDLDETDSEFSVSPLNLSDASLSDDPVNSLLLSGVTSTLTAPSAVSRVTRSSRTSSAYSHNVKQKSAGHSNGVQKKKTTVTTRRKEKLPTTKTKQKPVDKVQDTNDICRRAEKLIASLSTTGSQLTRKNKEITKLLEKQTKKIEHCRQNERKARDLLT